MSIADIKHRGLFRVDLLRIVLDLPHKEISEYLIESSKDWERYTTYHDAKLNKKVLEGMPGYQDMINDITKASHEFVKRTKRKPFIDDDDVFISSWVSIYDEHDQHGSHFHPKSLIAGTYYPQTSSESSAITLESPWTNFTSHDTIPFQELLFDYKPNPGDMLLWPAWLNHRVSPQKKSDTKRIAISFNIDYQRYHQ